MENSNCAVHELLVLECLNKRGLKGSVCGFQYALDLICLMIQKRSYTVKKEVKEGMLELYPDLDYAHLCNSICYALKTSGIDMTVREFLAAVYQDVQRELHS